MDELRKIILSFAFRRLAAFLAPLILGFVGATWWGRDILFTGFGIDPDNVGELASQLAAAFAVTAVVVGEFISWWTKQGHISDREKLQNLVHAAAESNTLHLLMDKAGPALSDTIRVIAHDYITRKAKQQALDAAASQVRPMNCGTGAMILVLALTMGTACAQNADGPTTNTINLITSGINLVPELETADGAWQILCGLGKRTDFSGTYTRDFKLKDNGGGLTTHIGIAQIKSGPWELGLGPAMATAFTKDHGMQVYFEAGVTFRVWKADVLNNWAKNIWLLDRVDWSTLSAIVAGWPMDLAPFKGPVATIGATAKLTH